MSAERALERCDELARLSEEEGMITRWYGSASLVAAADAVAGWMQEAGLEVRRDAVGNVIGRAGGGPGTFVLGSHIDTVRDAGRYDGPVGVLLAIEAADSVKGELPFSLEVVAFADEEGGRFPLTYLGSRGWAGDLTAQDAALTNGAGVRLGDAARELGGDPGAIAAQSRWIAAFDGMAGHAGNTPMHLRRDALAGAAELVLEVERLAQAADG